MGPDIVEKIKLNAAKCKLCGKVIVSNYRHDISTCACGNLTIDGGNDYLRRVSKKPDSWEDMSICEYYEAVEGTDGVDN